MNIRIENSVRNIYDCYAEVFIREEIIYKSPVISPDQSLEFATVMVDFTPGEYDGMAVFHYLDGKEELEVSSSVRLVVGVR